MSIVEWFFVGLIALFFLIVMIFTWRDLIRDRHYYREKSKNVRQMATFKQKKRKTKRR